MILSLERIMNVTILANMTVDLLKLFVAFGNVIGSIYYFIFD